jgi:purine nucleoside phosphorylase
MCREQAFNQGLVEYAFMSDFPQVSIAVIGGSANLNSGFPEAYPGVNVIRNDVVYDTPFGPSAPFTHAKINGREFLSVPFHGITKNISNTEPNSAGERVFYVLWKAGVKKILGTALCGSTNRLLDPADAVIPDGFVDYTTKRCQAFIRSLEIKGIKAERVSYRLHQSFCPELSKSLYMNVKKAGFPRVFQRGVVGVAEGPHLESPDDIRIRYTNAGIDVVTMNLVPEIYFSREIGACYACVEVVSNYGEGCVSTTWEGRMAFSDFQAKWARPTGQALLHTVEEMDTEDMECGCHKYSWKSVFG